MTSKRYYTPELSSAIAHAAGSVSWINRVHIPYRTKQLNPKMYLPHWGHRVRSPRQFVVTSVAEKVALAQGFILSL
jgi:hypothetical protein